MPGHTTQAVEAFRDVLASSKNHASATFNLGVTYRFLGQYADAARQFRALVDRDGHDVRALIALGECQEVLGRHDEALASFSQAVHAQPQHSAANHHAGRALMRRMRDAHDPAAVVAATSHMCRAQDFALQELDAFRQAHAAQAAHTSPQHEPGAWLLAECVNGSTATVDLWHRVYTYVDSQPGAPSHDTKPVMRPPEAAGPSSEANSRGEGEGAHDGHEELARGVGPFTDMTTHRLVASLGFKQQFVVVDGAVRPLPGANLELEDDSERENGVHSALLSKVGTGSTLAAIVSFAAGAGDSGDPLSFVTGTCGCH